MCIGQFIASETYYYICLRVFYLLWQLKKLYHSQHRSHRHYHFKTSSLIVNVYVTVVFVQMMPIDLLNKYMYF